MQMTTQLTIILKNFHFKIMKKTCIAAVVLHKKSVSVIKNVSTQDMNILKLYQFYEIFCWINQVLLSSSALFCVLIIGD